MPLWAAREKASTFVVRRRLCRKWAGDYAHPGTIVKCRLDPFRLPEETIPSWSRGGAPHPASAVMRTTLIESGKRIFMARRSYKHHERRGCPRRPSWLVVGVVIG